MVVGAICANHPQEIHAQGFTGEDFATWEQVSQDSYIQSSIMMAGVIATQIKPDLSTCIDDWYFASDTSKGAVNREIRGLISQYATYHPSGVILAALQQECGAFE